MIDRRALLLALASGSVAAGRLGATTSKAAAMTDERMCVPDRTSAVRALITYRTAEVNGIKVFYRDVGRRDAPVVLLLHGYPSSSRMFEPLFPFLARHYRLIAPDYPGFGLSDAPDRSKYEYTFDHLATTVSRFIDLLGVDHYAMYLQDYGGPVGFRLALAHPDRVRALIIQNAVLHEEGLTPVWDLRRAYWANRAEYEPRIRAGLCSIESGIARHVGDRKDVERFNPDLWMDEIAFLGRPGIADIQLDLAYDYQSNLKAYPSWQLYLRQRRPRVTVIWGVHDPIFAVAGAEAIQREQPDAEVHLLEAGHFAINEVPQEIAGYIHETLGRNAA